MSQGCATAMKSFSHYCELLGGSNVADRRRRDGKPILYIFLQGGQPRLAEGGRGTKISGVCKGVNRIGSAEIGPIWEREWSEVQV